MTTTWALIAILAAGTVIIKAAGPVLTGGRVPPPALTRVIAMLTPALVISLVITGTVTTGHDLTLDARLAGVSVGATALILKAPLILALVLAAATTAALRALT